MSLFDGIASVASGIKNVVNEGIEEYKKSVEEEKRRKEEEKNKVNCAFECIKEKKDNMDMVDFVSLLAEGANMRECSLVSGQDKTIIAIACLKALDELVSVEQLPDYFAIEAYKNFDSKFGSSSPAYFKYQKEYKNNQYSDLGFFNSLIGSLDSRGYGYWRNETFSYSGTEKEIRVFRLNDRAEERTLQHEKISKQKKEKDELKDRFKKSDMTKEIVAAVEKEKKKFNAIRIENDYVSLDRVDEDDFDKDYKYYDCEVVNCLVFRKFGYPDLSDSQKEVLLDVLHELLEGYEKKGGVLVKRECIYEVRKSW